MYNINGALKAVNHPELDPGKDPGRDGVSGSGFLPDYFGYVIDYHDQDYNRPFADFKSGAHPASTNSYSGLPRSTRWKTLTNVGISAHQSMYKYNFDDMGQLKEARLGTYTSSTSVYAPVTQPHDEFDILYDPNGNITRLRRTSSGNQLHDLNYNYTPETNKLATVTNSSTAFRTYSYYANGQVSSYIEHGNPSTAYYLKYDDAGHVLEICKAANFTLPVVRFEYNDLGHRTAKHSYHATTYQLTQSTFYLRDPSGRLLSVYQKTGTNPAYEKERYLYGMDMIGVMQMDISGQPPELEQPCEECPPPPPPLSIGLGCNGQRMYYLKDQVGNVRVILLRGTTAGTPPLAFQNYYPFGMKQPGGLNSSHTQRFGYQGEYAEQDPETKMAAFEARMYDAVTGRWLAVDPQHQFHSPYLAMGNNPVMMVDPDGEFVHLIIGGILGGVQGYLIGKQAGLSGRDLLLSTLAGSAIGAATSGLGAAISSTSILAGSIVSGAAGGFAMGALTGVANGGSFDQVRDMAMLGLFRGAVTGFIGGGIGGYYGGGTGAFLGGFAAGTVGAYMNGASPKEALLSGLISGSAGLGIHHMVTAGSYHLNSVKKETGMNYRQYSKVIGMTQRGNFRGKEAQVIGSRDGKILKSGLGSEGGAGIASPEEYADWGDNILFDYHSHSDINAEDRFSYQTDFKDKNKWSDQRARSWHVTNHRKDMAMYMISRQGTFHYWTSTEPGSYRWNLQHLNNQDYNYLSRTFFRW